MEVELKDERVELDLLKLKDEHQIKYFELAQEAQKGNIAEFLKFRNYLITTVSGLTEEEVKKLPLVEKNKLIKPIEKALLPQWDFTKD